MSRNRRQIEMRKFHRAMSKVNKRYNPKMRPFQYVCRMPCVVRAKGHMGCRFPYMFRRIPCHLDFPHSSIKNVIIVRSNKAIDKDYHTLDVNRDFIINQHMAFAKKVRKR